MVIVIHVANYFCRAYPLVGQGAYLYVLVLDTAARFSVPCFFMLSGAFFAAEKARPLQSAGKRRCTLR